LVFECADVGIYTIKTSPSIDEGESIVGVFMRFGLFFMTSLTS
jgi:hypothetical protein